MVMVTARRMTMATTMISILKELQAFGREKKVAFLRLWFRVGCDTILLQDAQIAMVIMISLMMMATVMVCDTDHDLTRASTACAIMVPRGIPVRVFSPEHTLTQPLNPQPQNPKPGCTSKGSPIPQYYRTWTQSGNALQAVPGFLVDISGPGPQQHRNNTMLRFP